MKLGIVFRMVGRGWRQIAAAVLLVGVLRPCSAQLDGDTILVTKVHPVAAIQDT